MNIFVLDKNIKKCAKYHCDKHVIKMILEYTQMLSTNVRLCLGIPGCFFIEKKGLVEYKFVLPEEQKEKKKIFLIAYINHPCTKWVGQSKENFSWLLRLTKELLKEYTYRYNKKHKTEEVIKTIETLSGYLYFPKKGLTEHALAIPEKYKTEKAVTSYRLFYINEKKRFATWKRRRIPKWYKYYS